MTDTNRSGDVLKALGGLLFAAGALTLWIRKGEVNPLVEGEPWGAFGLLILLVIPFLVLYGLALTRDEGADGASPWQTVFLVFAVLIAIPMETQFFDWIGANTEDQWINVLIALGIAVIGALAAAKGARFAMLIVGLALVWAWLNFWDELVDPGPNGYRWLLIIVGVIIVFIGVGAAAAGEDDNPGNELVTAGALALILGFALGLVGSYAGITASAVASAFGGSSGGAPIEQNVFWDVMLLITALGAIVYSVRGGTRGLAYVGGIGLVIFLVSVGVQAANLLDVLKDGERPDRSILWWPLLLLIAGIGALAAGFAGAGGGGGGAAPAAPSPPAAASPPAGGAPPGPPDPPAGGGAA